MSGRATTLLQSNPAAFRLRVGRIAVFSGVCDFLLAGQESTQRRICELLLPGVEDTTLCVTSLRNGLYVAGKRIGKNGFSPSDPGGLVTQTQKSLSSIDAGLGHGISLCPVSIFVRFRDSSGLSVDWCFRRRLLGVGFMVVRRCELLVPKWERVFSALGLSMGNLIPQDQHCDKNVRVAARLGNSFGDFFRLDRFRLPME